MKIRIGNDIRIFAKLYDTATKDLNIQTVRAYIINISAEEARKKKDAETFEFLGKFPRKPHVYSYKSSLYDINEDYVYTYNVLPKEYEPQPYHGFGVNPNWDNIYRPIHEKPTRYCAEVKFTEQKNVVSILFPSEAQIGLGKYSLCVVYEEYAPGYKPNNLKKTVLDFNEVFELVDNSEYATDTTDVYVGFNEDKPVYIYTIYNTTDKEDIPLKTKLPVTHTLTNLMELASAEAAEGYLLSLYVNGVFQLDDDNTYKIDITDNTIKEYINNAGGIYLGYSQIYGEKEIFLKEETVTLPYTLTAEDIAYIKANNIVQLFAFTTPGIEPYYSAEDSDMTNVTAFTETIPADNTNYLGDYCFIVPVTAPTEHVTHFLSYSGGDVFFKLAKAVKEDDEYDVTWLTSHRKLVTIDELVWDADSQFTHIIIWPEEDSARGHILTDNYTTDDDQPIQDNDVTIYNPINSNPDDEIQGNQNLNQDDSQQGSQTTEGENNSHEEGENLQDNTSTQTEVSQGGVHEGGTNLNP